MIGFSAGGHLAISIAEMKEPEYRLDFMMLIYPWDKIAALFQFGCISVGNQFLQVEPVETTPPIFMAVAKGDSSSKVETLSWYWQKVEELDIKPRRFKIYEEGEHGIGLGTHLGRRDTDHLKDWPNAATDFLQELSAKDIIPDFGPEITQAQAVTKETKRGGDVTQISEIPFPQTEVQASDLGGAPMVDPDVKINSRKVAKDAKTEHPSEVTGGDIVDNTYHHTSVGGGDVSTNSSVGGGTLSNASRRSSSQLDGFSGDEFDPPIAGRHPTQAGELERQNSMEGVRIDPIFFTESGGEDLERGYATISDLEGKDPLRDEEPHILPVG